MRGQLTFLAGATVACTARAGAAGLPPALLEQIDHRRVLFVDDNASEGGNGKTWLRALQSLQDALDIARASRGLVREIRIAGGVYKPDQGARVTPGDHLASFALVEGVALRGGYRALCRRAGQSARSRFDVV